MRILAGLAIAAFLITVLAVAPIVDGCTAFLASGEDGVLFGNNEDFWNPATKMWFVPAAERGYGAVYLRTGRIEASILVHFMLNVVHIFFFSYPALDNSQPGV